MGTRRPLTAAAEGDVGDDGHEIGAARGSPHDGLIIRGPEEGKRENREGSVSKGHLEHRSQAQPADRPIRAGGSLTEHADDAGEAREGDRDLREGEQGVTRFHGSPV